MTIKEPSPILATVASGNAVTPARQIRTDRHVIYLDPRISATKLAEYVLADPSRQETIARNAKKAPIMLAAPYSRVRSAFPNAFSSQGLRPESLRESAQIEITANDNDWHRKEKERSSAALLKLADIAPAIECASATLIHRPEGGWGNLMMGKTRVSVQPELVFLSVHRGIQKVGAVILNTGQGENLSLGRGNGKFTVGDYLTALLVKFLGERLQTFGMPLNSKCYAIDIHRGTVHKIHGSYKTLIKHMEASCRTLATLWDSLPGAESTDEVSEEAEAF